MKQIHDIFNDRMTRAAGIVFALIIVVVTCNFYTGLPDRYPLFGVIVYSLVPILFIVGGLIFILAILRSFGERGNSRT